MKGLSRTVLTHFIERYQVRYGLRPVFISLDGRVNAKKTENPLGNPPILVKARADAIREAVRWGEVYTFFIAPGIISWITAIVNKEDILGGLLGGEVIAEEETREVRPAVNYLIEAGCKKDSATEYVLSLPRWSQSRVGEAADFLFKELYAQSGLNPVLLKRNREHAQQQRQIAESIHQQKDQGHHGYSYDGERALFSLIRVGDKPGVRKMLNTMLARMFLNSPSIVMVQAYAIEMMGYLVRAAIENSPVLERMLQYHCQWIDRILKADTFEALCWEVREILDEFMDAIYLQGYNRTNRKAQEILDYIAQEYRHGITLDDIGRTVGLSSYRVAHLVKEATGKTVTQHIRQMRVREAQKLLLHTELSYVEIAYTLGFSDHSYFIKQFRQLTGTTPARFRNGA
jgi:YesN/AraC family two-component response regulator